MSKRANSSLWRLSMLVLGIALMLMMVECSGKDSSESAAARKQPYQLWPKAEAKAPATAPSIELVQFRRSLADRVAQLPPATVESLDALLDALESWKRRAAVASMAGTTRPTPWAISYEASDPELLASEVGKRIERVLSSNPPAKVQAALKASGRTEIHTRYNRIELHRVEMIGTGPVYYADPPAPIEVVFK